MTMVKLITDFFKKDTLPRSIFHTFDELTYKHIGNPFVRLFIQFERIIEDDMHCKKNILIMKQNERLSFMKMSQSKPLCITLHHWSQNLFFFVLQR